MFSLRLIIFSPSVSSFCSNSGEKIWDEGVELRGERNTLWGATPIEGPEWSPSHFCPWRSSRAQTRLKDHSEGSVASRSQGRKLGRSLEKRQQHEIMQELPQVFSSKFLGSGPTVRTAGPCPSDIRCFQAAKCSRFSRRASRVADVVGPTWKTQWDRPVVQTWVQLSAVLQTGWSPLANSLTSQQPFCSAVTGFPVAAQLTLGAGSFPVVGLSCAWRGVANSIPGLSPD